MDQAIEALKILFDNYIEENKKSEMGGIKEVFRGDPIQIPYASLPAIYIEPTGTPSFEFRIGYVEREFAITIGYVESLKDHVSGEWCDVVGVKKRVARIIEGVDETGKILDDTIVGILYKMTCTEIKKEDGTIINLAHNIKDISTTYEMQEAQRGIAVYQGLVTFTMTSASTTF